MCGAVFAPEGSLIAAPLGVVVGEDEDGGREGQHQHSEDIAIEHHDTAFVRTGLGLPPVPNGPSSAAH